MKRPEKYLKIQWSIVITGEFTHRYCYISLIIEGIMKGILFNISSLLPLISKIPSLWKQLAGHCLPDVGSSAHC